MCNVYEAKFGLSAINRGMKLSVSFRLATISDEKAPILTRKADERAPVQTNKRASSYYIVEMRGVEKCQAIIYRQSKYRYTSISQCVISETMPLKP